MRFGARRIFVCCAMTITALWLTRSRRASSSLPDYVTSTGMIIQARPGVATLTLHEATAPDIFELGESVYVRIPPNCEAVFVEKEAMRDFVDFQSKDLAFGDYNVAAHD